MGQSWVETETAGCDFGDGRLNRRLGTMLEALGERPGKSLPTAFQDWSNTKAAQPFPQMLRGLASLQMSAKMSGMSIANPGGSSVRDPSWRTSTSIRPSSPRR